MVVIHQFEEKKKKRRGNSECRRNYVHFIGKINVTKLLYFFVTRERSGRVLAIEFESLALYYGMEQLKLFLLVWKSTSDNEAN